MTDCRNTPVAVGQRVRVLVGLASGREGFVREICEPAAKSRHYIQVTSMQWPRGGWGGWYRPGDIEIVPLTAEELDVNWPTTKLAEDASVPGKVT